MMRNLMGKTWVHVTVATILLLTAGGLGWTARASWRMPTQQAGAASMSGECPEPLPQTQVQIRQDAAPTTAFALEPGELLIVAIQPITTEVRLPSTDIHSVTAVQSISDTLYLVRESGETITLYAPDDQ